MLDPDISTADARRLLSQPGHLGDIAGPHGWTRRKFLQAVGGGVSAARRSTRSATDSALGRLGLRRARRVRRRRRSARTTGSSSTSCSTAATTVSTPSSRTRTASTTTCAGRATATWRSPPRRLLPLDGTFGLHPSLTYTKRLWDAGQLAIVHGVGYPEPRPVALHVDGDLDERPVRRRRAGTGWVGRWLDGQPAATADLMAATIGSSVPLHLLGAVHRARGGTGERLGHVRNGRRSGGDPHVQRPPCAVVGSSAGRGQWHDMFATVLKTQLDLAKDVAPVYSPAPTGDEFVQKMTVAARLINANLGFRVLDLGLDSFDTHDSQPANHADLLDATRHRSGHVLLDARPVVLQPGHGHDDVGVRSHAVFERFGRHRSRHRQRAVRDGHQRARAATTAQPPSFATINDQWDRFDMTTDFRHVLGTVLDGWMGGGGSTILNGAFENLGFFLIGPGDPPPSGGIPPLINPPSSADRVRLDEPAAVVRHARRHRRASSARSRAGETWPFTIRGQFGVPDGAIAVAINLTAVDATMGTYVTAWPGGQDRPTTSNLNPVPGMAVPNLAIVRLGNAGDVNFFNNSGSVHLLADVVGYFRDGSSVGMAPLAPARLLDTRDRRRPRSAAGRRSTCRSPDGPVCPINRRRWPSTSP